MHEKSSVRNMILVAICKMIEMVKETKVKLACLSLIMM